MRTRKRGASALAEAAATMAGAAAQAAETEAAGDLPGGNGLHAVQYDDEDLFERAPELGPLFKLAADKQARHARTRVYRDEPIDEGHVGNIGPDDTEEAIARKWGGTTFHVEAVDEKGQFIARQSGIKIAAEPKFTSPLGRRQYAAWLKSEFATDEPDRPVGSNVTPIRSAEDQNTLEQDRHGRELARIKAESEAYALRVKADMDAAVAKAKAEGDAAVLRAKAEADGAVSRAKAESEERAGRDRAFYEAQQKQQNDFLVAMKGQERTGDPLQQLKAMSGILADLKGDSDGHAPDVATALVENMDKIIGAVDSATGGDKPRRSAGTSSSSSTAATGKGKGKTAAGEEEPVTLTDTLAQKARAAAQHLQKQGVKNPGAALSQQMERTFDRVMRAGVVEGGKGKPAPAKKPTSKGGKK